MFIVIGGSIGSDAGYWYIGSDGKIHHSPGWGPESMLEFASAINVVQSALNIRTPGVTERVIASVMPFIREQLGANIDVEGEGMVLLGGAREG